MRDLTPLPITVLGAGIVGLWQALTLAGRGLKVRLVERSEKPFSRAASHYAGAMLAPFCEQESSPLLVRELGLQSLKLWHDLYPDIEAQGSLVVAGARDRAELDRFAQMTSGHKRITGELATLESDLAGRFDDALFYPQEAHLNPRKALPFLLSKAESLGVEVRFGVHEYQEEDIGIIVDCTGMGAQDRLPTLRGVKGELALIHMPDINLTRPVRLLHPRFPIYVVPWGEQTYMVGGTVIEREDGGRVSVRSAIELLSTAYALHPAFGEAEIIELGSAVRPAFQDHLPKIIVEGRRIFVNGLYRHGFLLAPSLSILVADYLEHRPIESELIVENSPEWNGYGNPGYNP